MLARPRGPVYGLELSKTLAGKPQDARYRTVQRILQDVHVVRDRIFQGGYYRTSTF